VGAAEQQQRQRSFGRSRLAIGCAASYALPAMHSPPATLFFLWVHLAAMRLAITCCLPAFPVLCPVLTPLPSSLAKRLSTLLASASAARVAILVRAPGL
jgi:hypothetical protein